MSDIATLLSALDVFSAAPDGAALEKANNWLQNFQHSPEAWTTCNALLLSPEAPSSAKVFAAQTFRAKVTYDLDQLPKPNILPLRDTLITALQHYMNGPRPIVIQLCLALSALAVQAPQWQGVVQNMTELFGRDPALVPNFLEFLTALPDEITNNTRIPISSADFRTRVDALLTSNAPQVLELLTMYIQAPGVTSSIQRRVFYCLRNWLVSGEVLVNSVAKTPLLAFAFEALASDELFDAAVDVICDLIHETQEVDENMPAIEMIVPKVIALRPKLAEMADDSDKIRGLTRIFTEAGETYRMLLLQHPETFFPIVEAIGECSAYHDLDIVPLTFYFWMRLAQSIGKKPSVPPVFLEAYRSLMLVIIGHLHFPLNPETMSHQEMDDFRSFRHVMGDTLKDCCYVLGADSCLTAALELVTSALTRHTSDPASLTWQELEAPLFSMRSMGAEIDPSDNVIIPRIMETVPVLPNHPRLRYAALLLVARYSPWINNHPAYIQPQLEYISAGFDDTDDEVKAAAGQAMKYICEDCKRHLGSFLPQLHSFLASSGSKLIQDDRRMVYEAVAHVISALPMDQAAQALRTFSADILNHIHSVAIQANTASKSDLQDVSNALENLEAMLAIVQTFGDELPVNCQNTCNEVWAFFDLLIAKYGTQYDVCEHTTRVIRRALTFFGPTSLSVAPQVMSRLTTAFEMTGFASYIWIMGKIVGIFGNEEDLSIRESYRSAYERATNKLATLGQMHQVREMTDVLEDYVHMLLQMVECIPDILFESNAFPAAFHVTVSSMTSLRTDLTFSSLDLIRSVLTHDCLVPNSSGPPPPKFPIYAGVIQQAMQTDGPLLVEHIITGVTGDFPEETTSLVVTIFRSIAANWPRELLTWLPAALQQTPSTSLSDTLKTQFLADVTSAVNRSQLDKIKYSLLNLHRQSRKARDRRRISSIP